MRFSKNNLILFSIILLGFVLRIWGLSFGLPFQFHQDEPIVVNHALAYGTGDFNPHFFAIPPLASYLLFLVYGFLFLAGKILNLWISTTDFGIQFIKDPTLFYLSGRVFLGVIPGIISVFLTYFLASKTINIRAAKYSACFMSVCFLNIVNGHYIYTDMLLVMFSLFFFFFLFNVIKTGRLKDYIVTSAFLGASIGAKYNGIILFVPFLAALLGRFFVKNDKDQVCKKIIYSAITCIAVYFITNPFTFLDWNGFIGNTAEQSKAFWYTGLTHHIWYSLREGISLPLLLSGIVGLGIYAFKKRLEGLVYVSFFIFYYSILIFRSQFFARYVLVLVPILAIGSGYLFFDFLWTKKEQKLWRMLVLIVAIAVIIPTTIKSIKADVIFSSGDTRLVAAEWIKKNLPEGEKIACDNATFRPALKQPYSQILEKEAYLRRQKGMGPAKRKKLDLMKSSADPNNKGYPLYFLFSNPGEQGQFLNTIPAIAYNISGLKKRGIRYVVINNQTESEIKQEFVEDLRKRAEIVKEFSPYTDGEYRKTKDPIATTCIPVKSEELFLRRMMGPTLRIYKIK